jgi:hypothetical protein
LASNVVVMVTPLRMADAAWAATSVLPRSTPCWSAKEKRTTSMFCSRRIFSAVAAAATCSSFHRS